MQTTDTATTTSPYYVGEPGGLAFKTFAGAAQRALEDALRKGNGKLFSVDTEGLFEFFLASFHDPVERQFHNCHCCQHFIKHYGGLVWIAEDGRTTSAVWDPNLLRAIAPKQYIDVAVQMKRSVENAQVVDQLLWKDLTWGKPEEGGFSHFYINVLSGSCSAVLTPGQDMAVRREDRKHLSIALGEMKPELIDRAIAMLEAGGLDRAETLLPMGKFLQETQRRMRKIAITRQNNILWHAVGQAARGWCTPRGSTFGALYYDIAEGKSTAAITRAHNEKMDPLKYQRPQAPPSAGNIKQAEKIVEQMGLAPAQRPGAQREDGPPEVPAPSGATLGREHQAGREDRGADGPGPGAAPAAHGARGGRAPLASTLAPEADTPARISVWSPQPQGSASAAFRASQCQDSTHDPCEVQEGCNAQGRHDAAPGA